EPLGVSYLTLLAICIPVTLLAVMLTAIVCNFLGLAHFRRSGLFAGILEPLGVSYLTLLAICIPVTLLAVMLTAIVCNFLG
ncbi:hypothetical protein CKQ90_34350, partial [Klebsiella pneumoniae]